MGPKMISRQWFSNRSRNRDLSVSSSVCSLCADRRCRRSRRRLQSRAAADVLTGMRKLFRLSQETLRAKNDFDATVNAKPGLVKAQGVLVVGVQSIIDAPRHYAKPANSISSVTISRASAATAGRRLCARHRRSQSPWGTCSRKRLYSRAATQQHRRSDLWLCRKHLFFRDRHPVDDLSRHVASQRNLLRHCNALHEAVSEHS